MSSQTSGERPPVALDATRRGFLRRAGLLGAGIAVSGPADLHSAEQQPGALIERPGEVPRRAFGRTGVQVSIIGIGGHAIGQLKEEKDAVRLIHEAMDAGVNFMDNAWEYHDGRSEEWMGKALEGRRDKAFLMTKVCSHGRDRKVAMQQLEDSLRRLRTDHLDLWQIHEVVYDNDPEWHFRKDGAVEALDDARKQGKVRFVGFTGHKDPAIHLKMLSHNYPFDACQLPLNVFDGTFRSFEQKVLPELNRRGIAAIGMKSLCGTGDLIRKSVATPQEALRYAMSLPVAVTVSGMNNFDVLRQNLDIARKFKPLTPVEMQALRQRVAPLAADGRFERFKTTMNYDGPVGQAQHGFTEPQKS